MFDFGELNITRQLSPTLLLHRDKEVAFNFSRIWYRLSEVNEVAGMKEFFGLVVLQQLIVVCGRCRKTRDLAGGGVGSVYPVTFATTLTDERSFPPSGVGGPGVLSSSPISSTSTGISNNNVFGLP